MTNDDVGAFLGTVEVAGLRSAFISFGREHDSIKWVGDPENVGDELEMRIPVKPFGYKWTANFQDGARYYNGVVQTYNMHLVLSRVRDGDVLRCWIESSFVTAHATPDDSIRVCELIP